MIGNRPLSENEIRKITKSLPSLRDKVLFLLGCKTGFRISEILSLKVEDMLQYGKIKRDVTVEKRNTKTQLESRTIPLSKDVIDALSLYLTTLPPTQIWLFQSRKGSCLSRHQAWRNITKAVDENKLTGNIATHSMRKTFAQNGWKATKRDIVKLAEMLGQKNINSTRQYISFDRKEIDKTIVRMGNKTYIDITS